MGRAQAGAPPSSTLAEPAPPAPAPPAVAAASALLAAKRLSGGTVFRQKVRLPLTQSRVWAEAAAAASLLAATRILGGCRLGSQGMMPSIKEVVVLR